MVNLILLKPEAIAKFPGRSNHRSSKTSHALRDAALGRMDSDSTRKRPTTIFFYADLMGYNWYLMGI